MIFFGIAIPYGFLFSLPEGLGVPVSADSPWPPLRWLYGWAVAREPAHLDPPVWLLANCLYDGLVQAPFLVFLVYAFARSREWIRIPGLLYAGSAVTNMGFYFFQTFLGAHPPTDLVVYIPMNLPWLIAPAILALRLRAAPVFRDG